MLEVAGRADRRCCVRCHFGRVADSNESLVAVDHPRSWLNASARDCLRFLLSVFGSAVILIGRDAGSNEPFVVTNCFLHVHFVYSQPRRPLFFAWKDASGDASPSDDARSEGARNAAVIFVGRDAGSNEPFVVANCVLLVHVVHSQSRRPLFFAWIDDSRVASQADATRFESARNDSAGIACRCLRSFSLNDAFFIARGAGSNESFADVSGSLPRRPLLTTRNDVL